MTLKETLKVILMKLTSRKFLAALVTTGVGVALIFGADTDKIRTIAGAALSIVSSVTYIVSEFKLDMASINTQVTELTNVVDQVTTITDTIKGKKPEDNEEVGG